MPLSNEDDIQVFPARNGYNQCWVYDPKQREYYNNRTDIFLTEDDISFLELRPYSLITTPLPDPLPEDYFCNTEQWRKDETSMGS